MTGCILVVTLKNEGNNYVSLSFWWYQPKGWDILWTIAGNIKEDLILK